MGARLWFLLFTVNELAAFGRPQQLSSCRVLHKDVNCSGLNLTGIPPKLPRIVHNLDLSHNFLQNLTEDVLFPKSTIQLNLHSNRIQYIQPDLFRNRFQLHVLDLSKNQLHLHAALKEYLGPLISIKELDLSGNGLYTDMSDYFLEDAPALTKLSLNGNSITKIGKDTFSGSPALRNIDLHNNVILDIEEGTFDTLQNLTDLDLSMNSISCINDFNLAQLKFLNLSKNSMTSFQSIDSDKEFELLYLDLRENKIHYFPVLPYKNKLLYLDLSRNQLRNVNATGPAEELQYLTDEEDLTNVSLYHSKFNQDLHRLCLLDLSFNHLQTLPSDFFSTMVALETLNISNNCLSTFEVDFKSRLNALKTLDLSFNNLQNLIFGNCTLFALKTLYLQGNSLSTLDSGIFSRLPSITNLHLQLNDLNVCGPQVTRSCVCFSYIPTLQYLYLSENNLEYLPAYAFQASPLLILDLSLNPDLKIHKQALSGLEHSLAYLSLKGDQLQTLNMDLSLFQSLRDVDLSNNRLSSLPLSKESAILVLNLQNNILEILEDRTLMALERMHETLYISSNPLSCCGNKNLIRWAQQAGVDIPDIATTTCLYRKDSELMEISLSDVKPEHCEILKNNALWISMIAVLGVGLMVVVAVSIKLCHSRHHRFNHTYKA